MIHCFDVLLDGKPGVLPAVVAAFGDDSFLRKETTSSLLQQIDTESEDARVFDGEECKWIDVHDELATFSLFGDAGLRIAVVKAADKLIKDSRPQLEKWCLKPAEGSLLILSVNTLAANTKLYKSIDKQGLCVGCSLPTTSARSKNPSLPKLKKWMEAWAKKKLGVQLTTQQAQLVLDAVGPDCGLIHQEMSKLSLYADDKGKLEDGQVREHVGSWRTRTTWEIADAIMDGHIADALLQLEKVFAAGEHPAAVVPQVAWSLRRFGKAAHLILQANRLGKSMSASAAVSQSGFWGEDAKRAEGRLRRLGLRRASGLLKGLLELDLQIKGSHSSPARAVAALEKFCLNFI